ncbi:DUF3080 family protein [Pseudidiomarina taiwanensis]|uniref:DUF3080 domain-containing protein n=1 Tax=Pseudidiomarina taiwanensis TaxID=337250 RepID=A0A432ZMZ6_9GAMM|nr:DUF3080 family protein [Pseudidiomarina taiwanensis]RUO79236.1 hypothetical protein CWI83_01610 [Pseudidiomarina taiwanensis]
MSDKQDYNVKNNLKRCAKRCSATALLIGAVLFTSGCSEQPAALEVHDDYLERVSRVVEQPLPAPLLPAAQALQYPEVRELQLELAPVKLSLLDSLRLDDCSVGQTIAELNSSMGRLKSGLRRYYTDKLLVSQLQQCALQIQAENQELAAELTELAALKQAQQQQAKQLAFAQEPALRNALSASRESLDKVDSATFAPNFDALQVVLQVMSNQPLPEQARVEAALEQLENDRYLPALWRSMQLLNANLSRGNALLKHTADAARCDSPATTQTATVLRTIFAKYFAQALQQQVAGFSQQAYQLEPILNELEQHHQARALSDHLSQLQTLNTEIRANMRAQAELWQSFFKACRFTPGA